jgi:thioredoxin-dependent peroxiredoxin
MLEAGQACPKVSLADQTGTQRSLAEFRGRQVLVFFYPKADTPGCTQQACGLRDISGQIGDVKIVGISPDKPAKQAKFDEKYSLGYPLLADVDHVAAEAFDVWQEKSLYGKTYMGVVRSAFLIGADGKVASAWYKISPKDTPLALLEALGTTPAKKTAAKKTAAKKTAAKKTVAKKAPAKKTAAKK